VRQIAVGALEKILSRLPLPPDPAVRRREIHTLHRWAKKAAAVRNDEARRALEALLLRLERLEAAEMADLPEKPGVWARYRRAGMRALAGLLLGLAGVLAVLLAVAEERLKEAVAPLFRTLSPGLACLLVFLLAAAAGLVGWAAERARKG